MFNKSLNSLRGNSRSLGLVAGLLFSGLLYFFVELVPGKPAVTAMAAIALLMSIWWVTEAVPLAATSLLPLILFPLLNVSSGKVVAGFYMNSTIFLFVGGIILAVAMESWNLHKRIALFILSKAGRGPGMLILGFMVACATLSMWISNTATAIMMLPIGLALLAQLEERFDAASAANMNKALLLSIAYACSIGGMATLVGTPPNLVLRQVFQEQFPGAPEISFGQWFLACLPLSIVLLGVVWLLLTRVFFPFDRKITFDRSLIAKERKALGPMSFEEKAVMIVFFCTALLWVFRKDLNLGFVVIPGWSSFLAAGKLLDDGTVAILAALILFIIPARSSDVKRGILDLNTFQKLPWSIIILFGGGFALAGGFTRSGLSTFLAGGLSGLDNVHPLLVIFILAISISFITELTSNTASSQMLLPIVAALAVATETAPLLFMIPATLAASLAFMMPVATPPNAIVFGSNRIKVWDMVRGGFFVNIISVSILTLMTYFYISRVFGL